MLVQGIQGEFVIVWSAAAAFVMNPSARTDARDGVAVSSAVYKAIWRQLNPDKVRAHKEAWRIRNGLPPSDVARQQREIAREKAAIARAERERARAAKAAAYKEKMRSIRERTEKACSVCKVVKQLADFVRDPSGADGTHHACRGCERERSRAKRKRKPPRQPRPVDPMRKWNYYAIQIRSRSKCQWGVIENITGADVLAIFERFKHRCYACGKGSDLTLDHHVGLEHGRPLLPGNAVVLCRRCNSVKAHRGLHAIYSEYKIKKVEQTLTGPR